MEFFNFSERRKMNQTILVENVLLLLYFVEIVSVMHKQFEYYFFYQKRKKKPRSPKLMKKRNETEFSKQGVFISYKSDPY